MRVLFLLLVLANLGFAAWHVWFSEAPAVVRPVRPDAPGIRMYAEAAASQPVATFDRQPEPVIAASGVRDRELVSCISVGPLPSRVEVDDATRTFSAAGFVATQRVSEGEVWLGNWVYIDAIPTQTEAAEIVARLAENGIREAYVIADGDNGNIVSLGVFSVAERARQRFAEAQALGYVPTVVDRSQPGEVYWLDVAAPDRAEFAVSELPSLNFGAGLRFEECSDLAGE